MFVNNEITMNEVLAMPNLKAISRVIPDEKVEWE